MIKNYLKTAWRNITRNKVYTGINILGLSLGIAACLVIYLITSFELSYDKLQPDKERIYRIVTSLQNSQGKKNDLAGGIGAMPIAMRNELSGFETTTSFCNIISKVIIPNGKYPTKKFEAEPEFSPIIIAEPQYFDIFKYQWLVGNAATALNAPYKVVLSENEAHKYFGAQSLRDIIGREVIYRDSLHFTVSGIVKDLEGNTDLIFKDFLSFATVQNSPLKYDMDMHGWGMWDYNTQGYVKLAKGVTTAQVEKQFPQFIAAHIKMQPGNKTQLLLQPLADLHFNNTYNDTYSRKAHLPTLYGLMGIAIFILLIAAINFINLSTAQSLRRAREVGVRKVLGSSKANLTTQFLIETFLVTIAAVFIAVLITNPILSFFSSMVPLGIKLNLLNPATLLFLLAVIIITSLLAGFYPATVLSSYLPALSLKGQGSQKLNRSSYLRKTLIVFQFTVSLIFIIGTIIVARQVHFVLNKDLGFNKDAIVTTHVGWTGKGDKLDVFENKIAQIPGVQLVTRHRNTPMSHGHPGTFMKYSGKNGEVTVDASFDMCDDNYLPLFGLKLIAGRNLVKSDTLKEFLVNETCARALGFTKPEDALGQIVQVGINNKKGPIVGIVKDFHSASLHEAITPFFFTSNKRGENSISIKLATTGRGVDAFKSTIAQISKASLAVYPNEKFEYKFLDETIASLYEKEQKTSQLMYTAMGVAIFISCMGLFGLAAFTAQQRVKEIGIRKVLGATTAGIVSMLSKDFLVLIVVAIIIASPIAYYFMHLWLLDFAYRVNISWWVFVAAGLAAVFIALLTISFQSMKASLANPVKSLRSE